MAQIHDTQQENKVKGSCLLVRVLARRQVKAGAEGWLMLRLASSMTVLLPMILQNTRGKWHLGRVTFASHGQ